jgi:hypothetical protein
LDLVAGQGRSFQNSLRHDYVKPASIPGVQKREVVGERRPSKKFKTGFAKISEKAVNWQCGALNNRACTPKEAKKVCASGLKKNSKTNMCVSTK